MKNLRPSTKLILAFICSFIFSYLIINLVSDEIKHREQLAHIEAATILQKTISERFNLLLDITLVIGQMSTIFEDNQNSKDLLHKILEDKKYILGINQLNPEGKIVSVYPFDANQDAIGKVTQNYSEVLKSYNQGNKFWFSPPFKLFQGGSGFVFYIPIETQNKFKGWIAPVISSKLFFEHFRTLDFFTKYHLIIKDEVTGTSYFETGLAENSANVEIIKSEMWGRSISFKSWPKLTKAKFELSLAWRLVLCLLSGLLGGLMMKIHLQKKKAYSRLENISDLLKLTSSEALSKLTDIQAEYLSTGSTGFLSTNVVEKDVQSVTNLIEQIELLQNIAGSEELQEESFEILPLVIEQLEVLREIIQKKDLKVELDTESFKGVKITGNRWLTSNTVLKNALSYSVLISKPAGKIEITHHVTPTECSTLFRIESVYEKESSKAFKIERRLLVAQNVMDLLNGKIMIHEDGTGGMILKLTISMT